VAGDASTFGMCASRIPVHTRAAPSTFRLFARRVLTKRAQVELESGLACDPAREDFLEHAIAHEVVPSARG
jgi:hypothetical protein